MSIVTTWTTALITGLRGNGKTLKAVQMMREFIQAGHPVYACNFEGLTLPGVQFLDDPHNWRDLPPGSVLFVDEAQRFWRSRRSGEPPESIIAMETQRHDGVRMVILTQQPTYLDKHLRGLVDVHIHLVRRAGMQVSQVYEWERCHEEPNNPASMELAEKTLFPFPSDLYGAYKSAEVHTVKAKVPLRLKLIVGAAVLAVSMFAYAISSLGPDEVNPAEEGEGTAVASAEGDAPARSSTRRREPLTRLEYVEQMQARIPGALWSAPVFDDTNKATEQPEVYCMIGETCRCITEQGTRYAMEQNQCRRNVLNGGIYNPFKRAREQRGDDYRGDEGVSEPDGMATQTAPVGITLDSEAVTGQGDMTRAHRFDAAADNGFSGGG